MALLKTFKDIGNYFREIAEGVASLIRGMKVTGRYFVKPSEIVTQKYPENRAELKMFDNFKGELVLLHNDKNQHRCDACYSCERKCPNGSIEVISSRVTGPDGRTKRVLDKYVYHLDTCTFCGLCVEACDQDALAFSQEFEHAVFDKSALIKVLNHPGSIAEPKEEEHKETKE